MMKIVTIFDTDIEAKRRDKTLFLNKNLMKNDKIYKGCCSGFNFKRKKKQQ